MGRKEVEGALQAPEDVLMVTDGRTVPKSHQVINEVRMKKKRGENEDIVELDRAGFKLL